MMQEQRSKITLKPQPGQTVKAEQTRKGPHGRFPAPTPFTLGLILAVALLAFEAFNFDTTQYALNSLLGEVRFLTVRWATILAVAFCAIDFAGLVRFFLPDNNLNRSHEYWYLTGAWLLGASMNAIMTWWAVSLTLLNHNLGNEILSRAQLLEIVPIFVAVLVWLTRILFIGAFTVAGGYFLTGVAESVTAVAPTAHRPAASRPIGPPRREQPAPHRTLRPAPMLTTDEVPAFLRGQLMPEQGETAVPWPDPLSPTISTPAEPDFPPLPDTLPTPPPAAPPRVRRRPPTPVRPAVTPMPVQASSREVN